MNSSFGISGSSHQNLSSKRSHSVQSSIDFRELTTTLQQLNEHFKKTNRNLTEIKDFILKVCEKQDSRPIDDISGVHKLEKVRDFIYSDRCLFSYHLVYLFVCFSCSTKNEN